MKVRHKWMLDDENQLNAQQTGEASKLVSQSWRALSPRERAFWTEEARKDKRRYERELNNFQESLDSKSSLPKKPCSAFFTYAQTRRQEVARLYPERQNSEISKLLSVEWNRLDPEIKQPFLDEYERKVTEYKRLMEPFRGDKPKRRKKPLGRKGKPIVSSEALQLGHKLEQRRNLPVNFSVPHPLPFQGTNMGMGGNESIHSLPLPRMWDPPVPVPPAQQHLLPESPCTGSSPFQHQQLLLHQQSLITSQQHAAQHSQQATSAFASSTGPLPGGRPLTNQASITETDTLPELPPENEQVLMEMTGNQSASSNNSSISAVSESIFDY